MDVRLAGRDEYAEVARLCGRSVRGLGGRAYTPEQVEVWAAKVEGRDHAADAAEGAMYLVADPGADDGHLAGVTALYGDEIHILYVDPEHVGQGLATRLTDLLEGIAARGELRRLRVTASRLARPFYQGRGYHVVRSKSRELDGVPFEVFEMARDLGAAAPGAAPVGRLTQNR